MRKPGEKHRHGRMQLPGRLGCHSESRKWDWKWGQESEPRRKGNSSGSPPGCPAQHVAWEGPVGEGLGLPHPHQDSRLAGGEAETGHPTTERMTHRVQSLHGHEKPQNRAKGVSQSSTHRASAALGIFNLIFFFN